MERIWRDTTGPHEGFCRVCFCSRSHPNLVSPFETSPSPNKSIYSHSGRLLSRNWAPRIRAACREDSPRFPVIGSLPKCLDWGFCHLLVSVQFDFPDTRCCAREPMGSIGAEQGWSQRTSDLEIALAGRHVQKFTRSVQVGLPKAFAVFLWWFPLVEHGNGFPGVQLTA